MLNRDFFRILIKVIGLYFFIQMIFSVIPSQISFLGFDSDFSQKISTLIYIFLIALLSLAILYFLIRSPDKIIDLFKLDKGFDNDKIPITNFNSRNILTIALFIVGAFLIIENLTTVISLLFYEFKKSNNPLLSVDPNNNINLILSALNLILGCMLIIFRKNISAYFEK
jgi:hypothetical protein